jgi:hypothetical protein
LGKGQTEAVATRDPFPMRPPHVFAALVGVFALATAYAASCGPFAPVPPEDTGNWPKHHPIGKPLPESPSFNQPDGCGDGFWFFDANRNHRADLAEPRLFGPDKQIACASCHGESASKDSANAASVFLRQNAGTLCLVCHRL